MSLSFFGIIAHAQILIKATDKSVRYDLIRSSQHFEKVTIYDSGRAVTEEWINENLTKVDSSNGQIIFARSKQIPFGQQISDSTTISTSGTPVSYQLSTNPFKKTINITFNPDSATAKINSNGTVSTAVKAMPKGYFDENVVEELLGYISFEKGKTYHLNAFSTDVKSTNLSAYDIEYVFDDVYQILNGNLIKCSVLHYTDDSASVYVWVDRASHANLKEVFQNKTGGMTLVQRI